MSTNMEELEELREEKHRLNLRLESERQSSSVELDFLRDELQLKEREYKEHLDKITCDGRNKEAALQERIATLNEDLNLSREEVEKLREQNESVKANLELIKSARNNDAVHRRSNVPINADLYEELKESLQEKEKVLARANETIASQSERLREYNEIIEAQKSRIVNITENIETQQNTILEQQERLRQVEIERNEQIQQQQQRVLDKCDNPGKSRGNSLFSEVEERRMKVEDELRRLRDLAARLSKENIELQASVERGDSRHRNVSSQLQILERSEQQMIQELKKLKTESLNLFDKYQERLETLRTEYHKKLLQYKGDSILRSDEERLREERDQLILAKMTLERELFECKKDLKYTKHMKTECEAHLKILRIKFQDQSEGSPSKKSESNHHEKTKNDSIEDSPDDVMVVDNKDSKVESTKSEEIGECKQQ